MPAFCAAIGSFHVKSPTTYFVMVLMTVRGLPFFLTVTLIRSRTLIVSTLGVRSYSDQRYSSMQISATRHSLGVSTGRTAGFGYSLAGSDVNRDTGHARVSGGRVGSAVAASRSSIGVAVFSMPDEPKPPSLAAPQPARATVPLNAAKAANRRGLITPRPPLPSKVVPSSTA